MLSKDIKVILDDMELDTRDTCHTGKHILAPSGEK